MLFFFSAAYAQETKIINVINSGTLNELVSIPELNTVKSLKLTGKLNAIDLNYLSRNMQSIYFLDLKEVDIEKCEINNINYSASFIPDNTFNSKFGFNGWHLKQIVLPESLRRIGNSAFRNCSTLDHIIIPELCDSIGEGAFLGCISLKSAEFKSEIRRLSPFLFCNCSELESISISPNLEEIGAVAFSRCFKLKLSPAFFLNLKRIEGGAFEFCHALKSDLHFLKLEFLGQGAFYDCNNLTSVNFTDCLKEIGLSCFQGCSGLNGNLIIPDSIKVIEPYTFADCSQIDSVFLPDGLEIIKECAFRKAGIKSVKLPVSLRKIECYAFSYCSFLSGEITIPSGVTEIEECLFFECPLLTKVNFPSNLRIIKSAAFQGNSSLKYINLPQALIQIGKNAFNGCSSLENIVFPYLLNSIEAFAFYNCSSLNSADLPPNLSTLGDYAFGNNERLYSASISSQSLGAGNGVFSGCVNLRSLILSNGISRIGNKFLAGCKELKGELFLPESIHTIGEFAFEDTQLSALKFHSMYPPAISPTTFANSIINILTVPAISRYLYKQKYGNKFIYKFNELLASIHIDRPGTLKYLLNELYPDNFKNITHLQLSGTIDERDISFMKEILSLYELDLRDTDLKILPIIGSNIYAEVIFMPLNLEEIRSCCFKYSDISTVYLNKGLRKIGDEAFYRCAYLENIELPENLQFIGVNAFARSALAGELRLPSGLVNTGQGAFQNCKNITSISFPESLSSIHEYSFAGCTGLKGSINFPKGLNTISRGAFEGCTNIDTITLPKNLYQLGNNAFAGCSGLRKVKALSENPPYLNTPIFSALDYDLCLLEVPQGTMADYMRFEEWQRFVKNKESDFVLDNSIFMTNYLSTGGSIMFNSIYLPTGSAINLERNENIVLTIIPDEGYVLKQLKLETEDITDKVKDSILKLDNVQKNITLNTTFEKRKMNVTIRMLNSSLSYNHIFNYGSTPVIELIPENQNSPDFVLLNGEDVTSELKNGCLHLQGITEDVLIEVKSK